MFAMPIEIFLRKCGSVKISYFRPCLQESRKEFYSFASKYFAAANNQPKHVNLLDFRETNL